MGTLSSPIDLIKKSFRLFFDKENMIYFLKIYVILVPFAIFSLYQDSLININTQNLNPNELSVILAKYGWLLGLGFLVNLAYLVISFWVSAAGITAVSGITAGSRTPIREVFGTAWKKLWVFSLLSIVVGLITGFGFLLLIIPGILFLVWFRFSGFEILTKDIGVGEAMRNSKKLVSGRFWKVFGRILVFGLFGILVGIVFSAIPMGIGSVISPLFGALLVLPYFLLYKELSG